MKLEKLAAPGAPACSDDGCSAPGTGESTPAPQGVDMRQERATDALKTSACRHGPAPHVTSNGGDGGEAGRAK